ncbi:hypothetical protein BDQ17DRAFT_1364766 [Cyathus striatus]|nr:hypothetical protein BDQ17DRAFT_1364766 [Cyathus striatus]
MNLNFNPDKYPNVDPDLLYKPGVPQEEWIDTMLKKLPLSYLPNKLRPYPAENVDAFQPPMFYFGIPMDGEKLFKLAKAHDFLVVVDGGDPRREDDFNNMDTLATLEVLEEKIHHDFNIICKPEIDFVKGLSSMKEPTVLHFLTSYDVKFPVSPEELNKMVQKMLGIEENLMWFVSDKLCVWVVGPINTRDII